MTDLIHRALLLVEDMLLFVLNGAEEGTGLIRRHLAILTLISCGGSFSSFLLLGLLILFLSLLATRESALLFLGG